LGETPEPLLKQEATFQPGRGPYSAPSALAGFKGADSRWKGREGTEKNEVEMKTGNRQEGKKCRQGEGKNWREEGCVMVVGGMEAPGHLLTTSCSLRQIWDSNT